MDKVPTSSLKWDDDALRKKSNDEVQRLIVLDGPNVMHSTTPVDGGDTVNDAGFSSKDVSITGLLVMMRYFIKNDFDVVALISSKYSYKRVLSHSYQRIKELEDIDLVCVVEENTLDDLVLLEAAKIAEGVVLSKDHFKDHYTSGDRYMSLVTGNSAIIDFKQVSSEYRHKMSTNGHYVAYHTAHLPSRDMLFSTPKSIRHELVEEYRENWSESRKKMMVEKIDSILLEIRKIENVPSQSSDVSS